MLSGQVTHDGWTIGRLVQKESYQTGGNFSVGYLVEHPDGRAGFLKALDFRRALRASDMLRELEGMTRSYNFERDVLALCRGENLSRVVVAIADGELTVPDAPMGRISYLIFELADGDVRKHATFSNSFDCVWSLRALHHVCTGVAQLHSRGVFHQDVKPSNILIFGDDNVSKLADLGRAHCTTIGAPHDHLLMAGVQYYAPPEHLYNFHLPDHLMARAAADLYLVGSMLHYFFMGTMITPSLLDNMRPEHKPMVLARDDSGWGGDFEGALPYVADAFAQTVDDFRRVVEAKMTESGIPKGSEELVSFLTYLCEPDPRLRGHPGERKDRAADHYSMRRFVSAFDRLATSAEIAFRRKNAN